MKSFEQIAWQIAWQIAEHAVATARVREGEAIESWCDRCRIDRKDVPAGYFEALTKLSATLECPIELVMRAQDFDGFEAIVVTGARPQAGDYYGVVLHYVIINGEPRLKSSRPQGTRR